MKLIFTIAFLSASVFVFSQDHGEIQGTIMDATSEDQISYATVQLEGTAFGAISEENGFYTIPNVPAGTYQLIVSYVGYESISESVEVQAGQVTTQNMGLSFTTVLGEEVVVTAMAMGQAQAINTQLSSINIKNVVSEQKIRELPDANAAESLARLPGVSVLRSGGEAVAVKVRGVSSNTIFVNGMRLDGSLGSIASAMIGGIELSKAFLPDQDADVLGGNIEFKLRSAEPGFKKTIAVRQGYNGFTKTFRMRDVNALLSNRFFDDKLGVMLSLTYDKKDRGTDNIGTSFQSLGSSKNSDEILPVRITSARLTQEDQDNDRYGITLYADYKLKKGKLYYQAFGSRLDAENYSLSNDYSAFGSDVDYFASYSEDRTTSFLQGVGGEHKLLGAQVDWFVSRSTRNSETPTNLFYSANNREAIAGSGSIDSSSTIQDLYGLATHDIGLTASSALNVNDQESYYEELAARLDIKVPFNLGSNIKGYLKFGGKVRDIDEGSERTNRGSGFQFQSGDQIGNAARERLPDFGWLFIPDNNISHESFGEGILDRDFSLLGLKTFISPDFDRVQIVADAVDDLLNQRLTADVNDYSKRHQYYAGYFMAGFDIGQMLTFTPGVRFERLDYSTTAKIATSTIGYGPYNTQGNIKDTTAGHFNEQFFPMVNLKFKPLDWFDIRLAATKTTTRPGDAALSPRYFKNSGLDITAGDIFLKPQTNYNYDLYLSFYTRKTGLFTIGAFYKKLTDQVLNYTVRLIDPTLFGLSDIHRNKNYTVPQNNRWPGYVRGLEFDWQTHFSYLPKPLNGIVFNINLTFMQSETRYPFFSFETISIPEPPFRKTEGRDDSRVNKVIGTPDVIGNISLGYERGGFAGRISAYYQSKTITTAQASNLTLDRDDDELLRFDMQLSQKFKKIPGLQLTLNINNLTNNEDRDILTHYPDRVTSREVYGTSGDIGLRYKF